MRIDFLFLFRSDLPNPPLRAAVPEETNHVDSMIATHEQTRFEMNEQFVRGGLARR